MTPIDGIVVGVGISVTGYLVFMAVRKCWTVATSMEKALQAVPKAVEAIVALDKRAEAFQQEIQFMRLMATGQIAPAPQSDEPIEPTQTPPREPVAYPSPFYGMYPIAKEESPEAKPEDSVVIEETDAEVAQRENFNALVEAGLAEADPAELRPGRQVESQ